ncbi:MAG: hypothetical protein CMP39_04005 [Rickettsiales bacterium]|nr:hypothetical protein [Rickettsiales bacterium]|tara:strand:+ start:267 stop:734 length:468 start_codon:yes stop_codon:yes gene_type:complete
MLKFHQVGIKRLYNAAAVQQYSTNSPKNTLIIAKEQLQKWSNALLTKNPEIVSKLYVEDATLKPTLDPNHKHSRAAIKTYFESFLQKGPQCSLLNDENQRVKELTDKLLLFTGKYEFSLTTQNNEVIKADFVFLYQFNESLNDWEIIKHSSSVSS